MSKYFSDNPQIVQSKNSKVDIRILKAMRFISGGLLKNNIFIFIISNKHNLNYHALLWLISSHVHLSYTFGLQSFDLWILRHELELQHYNHSTRDIFFVFLCAQIFRSFSYFFRNSWKRIFHSNDFLSTHIFSVRCSFLEYQQKIQTFFSARYFPLT